MLANNMETRPEMNSFESDSDSDSSGDRKQMDYDNFKLPFERHIVFDMSELMYLAKL